MVFSLERQSTQQPSGMARSKLATGDASNASTTASVAKRAMPNGKISGTGYVPVAKPNSASNISVPTSSGEQVVKTPRVSAPQPDANFGSNHNNDLKEYYDLNSGNQINLRPGRSREKYVEAQIFVKELKDRQTEILPEFSRIPLPHRTAPITDSKGDNNTMPKACSPSGVKQSAGSGKNKFCYECGAHYLSDVAKFCAECGIRRVAI